MVKRLSRFLRDLWVIFSVFGLSVFIVVCFAVIAGRSGSSGPAALSNAAVPVSVTPSLVLGYPAPPPHVANPVPTAVSTGTPSPAAPTPIAMPPSTYVSKELAIASWGSGPGQIGRQEIAGERIGPPAFCTDSLGTIYIIDQVNKRVNKYDPQGKFLSTFNYDAAVLPNSIWVWKDGSVFVTDQATHQDSPGDYQSYQSVWKLDPQGKPLLTYKWYGIYHIEDVRVDSNGGVWADAIGDRSIIAVQLGTVDVPFDKAQVQTGAQPGWAYRGGIAVSQMVDSPDGRGGYSLFSPNSGPTIRLPLPVSNRGDRLSAGSLFIDTDGRGNIYQDMIYSAVGGPEVHILAFDAQGRLTDQVELYFTQYYAPPYRAYHIDEVGRIYQMVTAEEGVRVIRWAR